MQFGLRYKYNAVEILIHKSRQGLVDRNKLTTVKLPKICKLAFHCIIKVSLLYNYLDQIKFLFCPAKFKLLCVIFLWETLT